MEARIFRMVAAVSVLIAVACGGFGGYSAWQASRQDQTSEAAFRASFTACDGAGEDCASSRMMAGISHAAGLRRDTYEERAVAAWWTLLSIPALFFTFYVVRFALTGRLQPLLPWRLP